MGAARVGATVWKIDRVGNGAVGSRGSVVLCGRLFGLADCGFR